MNSVNRAAHLANRSRRLSNSRKFTKPLPISRNYLPRDGDLRNLCYDNILMEDDENNDVNDSSNDDDADDDAGNKKI